MILSWKDHVQAGRVITDPVSLMDIFTTAVSATGTRLPTDRVYDGLDLLEIKDRIPAENSDRPLYWRTDFNKAVRLGPWKLVWNERDAQVFLYNLSRDPAELQNLASGEPDRVEKMKRLILDWEKDLRDPLWPGVMEFRFELEGDTTLWAI
jgi:arylsulfatase A-like enzyme